MCYNPDKAQSEGENDTNIPRFYCLFYLKWDAIIVLLIHFQGGGVEMVQRKQADCLCFHKTRTRQIIADKL